MPPGRLSCDEVLAGPLTQVNSPAVAEHALALMLSVSRKIFEARDNQHKKHWRPYISDPTAREFELRDKTIGIVGMGAIGEGVARLCKAFGCYVIGTKANPDTYPSDGAADRVLPAAGGLDTLLAESDFLVLTCPLSDETEGLIGSKELSAMKPSATLINCSRGPVVVESELIASLKAGEIAAVRSHSRSSRPLLDPYSAGCSVVIVCSDHYLSYPRVGLLRVGGCFQACLDVTTEEPLGETSELW